jgi:peptide subunit release factor 1 (eRF1)
MSGGSVPLKSSSTFSLPLFDCCSQDSGKYVFGVKDTLMCLDMGAVETLIVWEALDCDR